MAMGESTPEAQKADESRVMGNACFSKQQFQDAVYHYSLGIQLAPEDYRIFSNRCAAYHSLEEHNKALDDALMCVKLNADFLKGHLHLQRCLRHFERYEEALKIIVDALEKWPTDKELVLAKKDVEQCLEAKSMSTSNSSPSKSSSRSRNKKRRSSALKARAQPTESEGVASPVQAESTMSDVTAPAKDAASDENMNSNSFVTEGEESVKRTKDSDSTENKNDKEPPQTAEDFAEEEVKAEESVDGEAEAREIKEAGNAYYKAGKYWDALQTYAMAMEKCPKTVEFYTTLLNNRSAAYLMIRDSTKCRADCEESLSRDATQVKVINRLATTHVVEGSFDKAIELLTNANLPRGDAQALQMQFQQAKEKVEQNAFGALSLLFKLQEKVYCCTELDTLICRCHLDIGNYNKVNNLCITLLRKNPKNTAVQVIRVEATFRSCSKYPLETGFLESITKCLDMCKNLLASDPDSSAAFALRKKLKLIQEMIKKAKEAVNNREFEDAIEHFTAMAAADPKNRTLEARCLKERANANMRLKNYKECIADANAALSLDARLAEVCYYKARAHQELNEHDKAIQTLEKLQMLAPSEEVSTKLQDAIFKKKKFERPDLYAALGVPSIASLQEIRKGYRQEATKCHPDKAGHLDEKQKKEYEEKFKLITLYYEILTDPDSKALYDKGLDLEAIKEEVDKKKAQANFQSQFGGGGFGGGMPFGGGRCGGFNF